MADLNARDTKVVQYLNEALAKEKELETALTMHIGMTTRAPYKKRLQQHLRETKGHARGLERRIKQLGGAGAVATGVSTVASRALAAAKGPLHAIRGGGEQEKMLKNARTQYSEEHEEIATYTAIETLAEAVGDSETAKLARGIRREEERMARFLERLIPTLTRAVTQEEIPAAERRANGARRSSGTRARRASSGTRTRASASGGGRASASRAASSGTRSGARKRASGSRGRSGSARSS
jgi:ferritin-like metal-binding protein YciE